MPALNPSHALTVNLGWRSHPVYVGAYVLESLGALVEAHAPDATGRVVVASEAVGRLHGGATAGSPCGLRQRLLTVPNGVERMLRDTSRLCVEAEEAVA